MRWGRDWNFITSINLFHAQPLITPENLRFSRVFRGYRTEISAYKLIKDTWANNQCQINLRLINNKS